MLGKVKILTRPKYFLLIPICVFIIVEILLLRPNTFENSEEDSQSMYRSIESLIDAQKKKDEAGYTIVNFHYTAVDGETKNWEILAKEAVLYSKSRILLAYQAKIKMFDNQGQITHIEGEQALYKLGLKDIDLEGNVRVTFPDGFWVKTKRAHYSALTQNLSSADPFEGEAIPNKGEIMQMWGYGFSAHRTGPDIHIPKDAHARLRRFEQEETTDVRSDLANINRFTKTADFRMARIDRFVESMQGTLKVRSHQQQATYDQNTKSLKYLTAQDDVLIQETDIEKSKDGLKYATCQKADFLTKESKIVLTGFPSAYQGSDILTGEVIIVHRNENLIEVTQANAFHHGTMGSEEKSQKK